MTRRAEFLTALLLLSLLCACARQKPAVSPEPEAIEQPTESAPVSEAAPTFPAESEPATVLPAELEPDCPYPEWKQFGKSSPLRNIKPCSCRNDMDALSIALPFGCKITAKNAPL